MIFPSIFTFAEFPMLMDPAVLLGTSGRPHLKCRVHAKHGWRKRKIFLVQRITTKKLGPKQTKTKSNVRYRTKFIQTLPLKS